MPNFQRKTLPADNYCKCKQRKSITSAIGEWGYWDVCCTCKKPLEDGFHYYNHYDGEDHDDDFFE